MDKFTKFVRECADHGVYFKGFTGYAMALDAFEMAEQAEVDYTEHLIREALKRPRSEFVKPKPITGGEYFRFMNPGVSDEYDHDAEEE
jgi:hypothetical protein